MATRRIDGVGPIQQQLVKEVLYIRHVNPARIFRVQFADVPSFGIRSMSKSHDPRLAKRITEQLS